LSETAVKQLPVKMPNSPCLLLALLLHLHTSTHLAAARGGVTVAAMAVDTGADGRARRPVIPRVVLRTPTHASTHAHTHTHCSSTKKARSASSIDSATERTRDICSAANSSKPTSTFGGEDRKLEEGEEGSGGGEEGGGGAAAVLRELVLSASRRLHLESIRRDVGGARGRGISVTPKYNDDDVGILEFVTADEIEGTAAPEEVVGSGGVGHVRWGTGVGGLLKSAWQDFWVCELQGDEGGRGEGVPVWLEDVDSAPAPCKKERKREKRFLKFVMAKTGWGRLFDLV